jgi:hypothetical protein
MPKPKKPRTSAISERAAYVTSTQRTPFGRASHVKQYDAKALREEYDREIHNASQQRIGKWSSFLLIFILVITYLDERMKEDKAKVQRLCGDDDEGDAGAALVDNDGLTSSFPLESEDVLSGGVSLSISHAGGELLSILLDENDSKSIQ